MKTLTILTGSSGCGKTEAAEIMMEHAYLTHIEADQVGYDISVHRVKEALLEDESVVLCGVYFTNVYLIKYINMTSDIGADFTIKRLPQKELLDD